MHLQNKKWAHYNYLGKFCVLWEEQSSCQSVFWKTCKFGCEISHLQHSSKLRHIWLCIWHKQQRFPEVRLTPTRALCVPSAFRTRTRRNLAWATALLHVLNSFFSPAFQSRILRALVSLHLSFFLWCGSSTQADHQRLIYNWANTLSRSKVTRAVVDVDEEEREREHGGKGVERRWKTKKEKVKR